MPHEAHAWVATKVLQNEAGVANLETQFGEVSTCHSSLAGLCDCTSWHVIHT